MILHYLSFSFNLYDLIKINKFCNILKLSRLNYEYFKTSIGGTYDGKNG
jgi:hypothetical protein